MDSIDELLKRIKKRAVLSERYEDKARKLDDKAEILWDKSGQKEDANAKDIDKYCRLTGKEWNWDLINDVKT